MPDFLRRTPVHVPARPVVSLSDRYQAEWAQDIRAQGRDPYQRFAVASFRALKLKRRGSATIHEFLDSKFKPIDDKHLIPTDGPERDFSVKEWVPFSRLAGEPDPEETDT